MAIKGKKKAQSRGSQARRRPAGAPPSMGPRRSHQPWHKTAGGRVATAVIAVLVVSGVVGTIAAVNGSRNERAAEEETLDLYTDQVRALRGEVAGPGGQMATIAPVASKEVVAALGEGPGQWARALTRAEVASQDVRPPADLEPVHSLYLEATRLYIAAAKTFQLVTETERSLQQKILLRGTEQRDRANAVWSAATALLDARRQDLGMAAAGVVPPGVPSS